MAKKILKLVILFIVGGIAYSMVEMAWRGYTHASMFILGGILFIEIGYINELFTYDMGLLVQAAIGAFIITLSELIAGLILNIYLELNIWDYSDIALNFLGQISLPYSVGWFFISIIAIILDDWIRYLLFKEERPNYKVI